MEYLIPLAIFAALGILAGVLLTVASKVFAVEVDERVDAIAEALPQANCGACGFSGCADYADAIVNKGAECNLCRPGGEAAAKKIAKLAEDADLVVFDEIMAAVNYGMIPEKNVLDFLEKRPKKGEPDGLEVVLTGRNPSAALRERSDYDSEIRKEKHPFDRGITGRDGIER